MITTGETIRQAAALPLREGRVCVISSRNGKRLVIPKGWILPGQTAGETEGSPWNVACYLHQMRDPLVRVSKPKLFVFVRQIGYDSQNFIRRPTRRG